MFVEKLINKLFNKHINTLHTKMCAHTLHGFDTAQGDLPPPDEIDTAEKRLRMRECNELLTGTRPLYQGLLVPWK